MSAFPTSPSRRRGLICVSIIIATGASAKRLFLPGEDTYWQSGISACAVCDGAVPIFRNKPLAVIGGGDSAAEEATCEWLDGNHCRAVADGTITLCPPADLTKYGSHVYVLVRRSELRASKIMAKRLTTHPKVTVLWNVSVASDPAAHQNAVRTTLAYALLDRRFRVQR